MSQITLYVSGLEGQFSREKLRVPAPNATLKVLLETFCKEHKLGDAADYFFVSTTGSKKPYNMTLPFRLLNLKSGSVIEIRAFQKKKEVLSDAMDDKSRQEEIDEEKKKALEAAALTEKMLTSGPGSEEGDKQLVEDERRRAAEIEKELEISRRAAEKERQLLIDWGMDDDSAQKLAMESSTPQTATREQVEAVRLEMKREETTPEHVEEPKIEFSFEKAKAYVVNNSTSQKTEPKEEIPDEFFDLTSEDLRALRMASEQKKKAESGFRTREMREAERRKKYEQFKEASIRFRFPDRVEVFYVFPSNSRVKVLYDFLEFCLVETHPKFELYLTPPPKVLKDKQEQFINCHLVPAAIVNVRWNTDSGAVSTASVLKPALSVSVADSAPLSVSSSPHRLGVSSGASGPGRIRGPVCSVCIRSEGVVIKHCKECGACFCSECWHSVHSERLEMAYHHSEQPRLPDYPSHGVDSVPKSTQTTSGSSFASSSASSGKGSSMPKWFNPRKL